MSSFKNIGILVLACCCLTSGAVEINVMPTLAYHLDDQWLNIPPNRPPFLPVAQKAVRGQEVDLRITFGKFSLKDKKSNLTFDVSVSSPEGKISFEKKNIPLISSEIEIKSPDSVFLCPDIVKIVFEPSDINGEYKINVKAFDHIAQNETDAQAKVTLCEAPEKYEAINFLSPENEKIIAYYYSAPAPEKLIPFFLGLCAANKELAQKSKNYTPIIPLSFFYHAFKDNRYLLPVLAKSFPQLDPDGQKLCAILFSALTDKDHNEFSLLGTEAENFKKEIPNFNPFQVEKVSTPIDEDILWSVFFATGKFAPIKLLADAMEQLKNGISPDKYKNLPDKTQEDKNKLYAWTIGAAASWSLSSNAARHPMVFFYCETLFQRSAEKSFIKTCLANTLRKAVEIRQKKSGAKTDAKEKSPAQNDTKQNTAPNK